MFDCKKMAELATNHREGKLGILETLNYYLHFSICPPCKNYKDQIEKTIQLSKDSQEFEDNSKEEKPNLELLAAFRELSANSKPKP